MGQHNIIGMLGRLGFMLKIKLIIHCYRYRSTLMSSPSVNEPEVFNWHVAIALIAAWVIIYLCMVQGITESGKVVYVTAIFPYVVLIIFFFRGITLKGASDGLMHLFTPRWERLADPVVSKNNYCELQNFVKNSYLF